jgi:hypothetical protein
MSTLVLFDFIAAIGFGAVGVAIQFSLDRA